MELKFLILLDKIALLRLMDVLMIQMTIEISMENGHAKIVKKEHSGTMLENLVQIVLT